MVSTHDDGTDAQFVIGTDVPDAFGKDGVVVADLGNYEVNGAMERKQLPAGVARFPNKS